MARSLLSLYLISAAAVSILRLESIGVQGHRSRGRSHNLNSNYKFAIASRQPRQIQPLVCHVPGVKESGTCMFVYHCVQANGTHLGVCRDRFYIGTCCKLPSSGEEDDNLIDGSNHAGYISNEIDGNVKSKPKPKPTISSFAQGFTKFQTTFSTLRPFTKPSTTTTTTTTTTTSSTIPPIMDRLSYPDSAFFMPNGTLLISDPKLICGRRFFPASRIVGGADATYGKWPWQISIRTWQNQAKTYVHSCGAALLNENWAITAAHCVEKVLSSEIILRLGEFDLSDDTFPFNFTERRVQLIITHPNFSGAKRSFEYDLALLRFYEPVTFQPNIVPICIPEVEDFVNKTGFVTGWGRTYEGGPIPTRLNEVQVPIITNQQCEKMFLEAGYHESIPNIFLCAGWPEGGRDSCEGDSGGPLVTTQGVDNHFVLAAVISWGIGCGRIGHPGVYTRVTNFINWINVVSEF